MSSVATEMDQLRLAVGEVDALAAALLLFFDSSDWSGASSLLVDRTGYMLDLLAESASHAVGRFERFETVFVDNRPAGDSSPGEDMSAEDAAIVRRIRERCPDRRFDGGTDAELLDLFKHNRQVLSRSDEDVIAAMTRSR